MPTVWSRRAAAAGLLDDRSHYFQIMPSAKVEGDLSTGLPPTENSTNREKLLTEKSCKILEKRLNGTEITQSK